MASKAWNEAFALQGLGAALSAFAKRKAEQKSEARQQQMFEAQLAQKALELEDAKRNRMWQTQLDALKLTQPQTIYGVDKRTGQMVPQTVPGTSMDQIRATLPGLFQEGATPLAPAPKVVPFGAGGKGAGGSSEEYEKALNTTLAKEDADKIQQAGNISSEIALLTDFSKNLAGGKYYTGPGAGATASLLQPEFAQNLARTKNVAIAEYGKAYKGAMSDREFKTMIDGAVDPSNRDPKVLAANVQDLAEIRRIGLETAQNRAAWVAAGNRAIDFKVPRIDELIKRIQDRTNKAQPVLPGAKKVESEAADYVWDEKTQTLVPVRK